MTNDEGKEGFRFQVSGRKGIGQRAKGLGLRGDFVGGGNEEHVEIGIMKKDFKKRKKLKIQLQNYIRTFVA